MHSLLGTDPSLFAQLVTWVFNRNSSDEDEPDEAEDITLEHRKSRAQNAYDLLKSWETVPGLREDGGFDSAILTGWVTRARQLLKASDRGPIGDSLIGELLAHSPVDADGIWPHEAVRNLIEEVESRTLEEGMEVGFYNKGGTTVRSPFEGGQRERGMADGLRKQADATANKWPRTSALLRRLGNRYERAGQAEDIQSEKFDLRD